MAKADEQNTSPCYYSEEARAELRKHIEQVLARRQTCLKIDEWNSTVEYPRGCRADVFQ